MFITDRAVFRLAADGLTLDKVTLDDIQLGNVKLEDAISQNKVTIDGNRGSLDEFMGLLDTFPFWFNIVTP